MINMDKINADFKALNEDEQQKVKNIIKTVLDNFNHQAKFLPEDVKLMEFTNKVFDAYLFVFVNVLSDIANFQNKQTASLVLYMTLLEIFEEERILKFDYSPLYEEKEFQTMPHFIKTFLKSEIMGKFDTSMLVYIERYIEQTTGKATRFMQGF
ncbi:MAG: hypothetical protein BWY78_00811 [Alphaproteobacteria bacterium ADurb.Bin438]|nr:MAG: hypothetical protein BWY78_00811 [Alphaproteobacteria bacterium ADurb.Bin438]